MLKMCILVTDFLILLLILVLRIWFFIKTIFSSLSVSEIFIILSLQLVKVNESRNNVLIWDLMFPIVNLCQSPTVHCDPRWPPFLSTVIYQPPGARETEKKEYLINTTLSTNKFTAVLDTVDNYVNFQKTVVFWCVFEF